jgi:hypothetical protein
LGFPFSFSSSISTSLHAIVKLFQLFPSPPFLPANEATINNSITTENVKNFKGKLGGRTFCWLPTPRQTQVTFSFRWCCHQDKNGRRQNFARNAIKPPK